jgi:hypothetical protein
MPHWGRAKLCPEERGLIREDGNLRPGRLAPGCVVESGMTGRYPERANVAREEPKNVPLIYMRHSPAASISGPELTGSGAEPRPHGGEDLARHPRRVVTFGVHGEAGIGDRVEHHVVEGGR